MTSKEATVYIVDCGSTMGERGNGREETNLDWALRYIYDRITTAVATNRKTLVSGVIGLRTDETDNVLDSDDGYTNLTIFQPIEQILIPHLRKLRNKLATSSTEAGDAVSALVLAIQMITTYCRKLQYIRRIVLVTDARGVIEADQDDMDSIVAKLKEDNIELTVLGVDFDDAEYGFKEESKSDYKAHNESLLKQLCEDCGGNYGTLAQAIGELGIPRVKFTRPTPLYKGYLTLGNPEEFDTALALNVERYYKTTEAKPPSASKFVIRSDMGDATQASMMIDRNEEDITNDGLAEVKNARTYQIDDEDAPGGKRDVLMDELAKGYEYGRTAVHISESDRNVTQYETQAGMDIIGFVDKSHYEHYMDMSRTSMTVAQKTNDKAAMALSSFIHALYELESYAVSRLVVKDNKEPRIVLLAPNIEPDFECLYDVELPFAEDFRSYKFPPLDRVVTVSGKSLQVHRNLPSDDLQDAMNAYVDSMDLSTFGKDDEGEPTEYMALDETFSPMLHRLNQVIKHRAIHPDSEPPPPPDILLKYSQPPEDLMAGAKSALNKVIKAGDVKKVPPKARGKRFGRKDGTKPISELDINALLASDPKRKTRRIDPKNAIPEFKQVFASSTDIDQIHDAFQQMQKIIHDWIRHSVGSFGYGRAVEGIRAIRDKAEEFEDPSLFNDILRDLKTKILGDALGGDRREMWYLVRSNRLGLISESDTERSEVTADEAKQFLSLK